jgi:hypothetical protein
MDARIAEVEHAQSRFSYRSFLCWEFGYVLILLLWSTTGKGDGLKLLSNCYALAFMLRVGVMVLARAHRLDGVKRRKGFVCGNIVPAYERARGSTSLQPERQSRSPAYEDLGSIVVLLPVKSRSGLCCTMPIIVIRMQVLAGRRDRFMPQIVPHVSQVNLTVHHVRARRVPQPVIGRLS